MKRTILTVLSVLMMVLLVMVGNVVADRPDALFAAHLTAAPAAPDTPAQGQANFMLNDGQLNFSFALSRLQGDPVAAHIHISNDPGGDGPPVISLCGSFGPPPIPVAECPGPGAVTGELSLSEAQISDLLTAIEQNRSYVNVHSTAAPPGEVRGQLVLR